jgi:hypothetical protein
MRSMRVGISSWWFNRGQAVVGRQLRTAFDALGHETFVLARPTRAGNIRPAFIDRTGVWDQPGVTEASDYLIPEREMLDWARETGIEVAFFDQNYQFDEIAALRATGVKTVGRFVWEQFAAENVDDAKRAFDVVYSMHAAELERYAGSGSRARGCIGASTRSCSSSRRRRRTRGRSASCSPAASCRSASRSTPCWRPSAPPATSGSG